MSRRKTEGRSSARSRVVYLLPDEQEPPAVSCSLAGSERKAKGPMTRPLCDWCERKDDRPRLVPLRLSGRASDPTGTSCKLKPDDCLSERQMAGALKWRNLHGLVVNADLKLTPEAQASCAAREAHPEKASIESHVIRRGAENPGHTTEAAPTGGR